MVRRAAHLAKQTGIPPVAVLGGNPLDPAYVLPQSVHNSTTHKQCRRRKSIDAFRGKQACHSSGKKLGRPSPVLMSLRISPQSSKNFSRVTSRYCQQLNSVFVIF